MPARQLHQISAIVENSSWNHIKANRFPGLVARSIRTRLGSRRRPKLKTVQSCQNPTDSEPYDFSHISLPKVCLLTLKNNFPTISSKTYLKLWFLGLIIFSQLGKTSSQD